MKVTYVGRTEGMPVPTKPDLRVNPGDVFEVPADDGAALIRKAIFEPASSSAKVTAKTTKSKDKNDG